LENEKSFLNNCIEDKFEHNFPGSKLSKHLSFKFQSLIYWLIEKHCLNSIFKTRGEIISGIVEGKYIKTKNDEKKLGVKI